MPVRADVLPKFPDDEIETIVKRVGSKLTNQSSDKDYQIAAQHVVAEIYARPPAPNQIAGDKAIEWAMTQYFKLLLVDLVRTEGKGFTNHAICGPPRPEGI